jgi:muramidase (phage lysozyme)
MTGNLGPEQIKMIKEGADSYRSARPVNEIVDEFGDLAEEVRGVGKTSADMADEVIRTQKLSVKKSDLYQAYADSLAKKAKSIDTRGMSRRQINEINNVPKGLSRYNKDLKNKVIDSKIAKQVSNDIEIIRNTKTPKGDELLTQLKELRANAKYSSMQGSSSEAELYRDVEKVVREKIAEKNPAYNELKKQASKSFDEQDELKRILKLKELPQLGDAGEVVGKTYNPTAQTQSALKKLIAKPDEHIKEIQRLEKIFHKYEKGAVLKEAELSMLKNFVNDNTGLQNIRLSKTALAGWINKALAPVVMARDSYGTKAQEILALVSQSKAYKGAKIGVKRVGKAAWKSLPIIGGVANAFASGDPTFAIPGLGEAEMIGIPEGLMGKVERGEELTPEETQIMQSQGRQMAEQQVADVDANGPKDPRYLSDVAAEMGEEFANQAARAQDRYAKEFQIKEDKEEQQKKDSAVSRAVFESERNNAAQKVDVDGKNKAMIESYKTWEKARTRKDNDDKMPEHVTLNKATPEEMGAFIKLLKHSNPQGADMLLPLLEKSLNGDDLARNQLALSLNTPAIKSIIKAAVKKPEKITVDKDENMMGLLGEISEGEGTSKDAAIKQGYKSGYDVTLGYGKFTGDDKSNPITEMTLGELDKVQTSMLKHPQNNLNSSAVGKYQIVQKTLRGLKKKLKIKDSEKYTPELQDRLAKELVRQRTARAKKGGSIQEELSKEWASLPSSEKNRSYYDKKGTGRKTSTTTEEIKKYLENMQNKTKKVDSDTTKSKSLDELLKEYANKTAR